VVDQIHRAVQDENLDLVTAERRVLGIDHAELGGRIARAWNLSEVLAAAIHHHHLSDPMPTVPPETAMVYLADSICTMSGINADLFCNDTIHHDRIRKQLRLSESEVNRIMSDFYSQKENIYGLLAIL
jgi:HD-like signal output (HDOD) protein